MTGPVFIIGGSRTGSEMLKAILSASSEVDLVPELFLLCPAWLHRDLSSEIDRHVGKLEADGALDRLMDLLYSGKPYGWVWERAGDIFPPQILREQLTGTQLSLRTLLHGLMEAHARSKGKRVLGAKFPVHYGYTDRLLEWFPQCRLVHTTRDPRAVYASQARKYLQEHSGRLQKQWLILRQFAHINIQTSWTARVHKRLKDLPNYRLVRYEDMVSRPEQETQRLCKFLGVSYEETMVQPVHTGSSHFRVAGRRGVGRESVDAWRTILGPAMSKLFPVLHPFAYRGFGYL